MNITLNVGGKKFETTHQTLAKIPVFKHMFEACGVESQTLFIDRSPHVFKHVLALAQDSEYLFPAEFEYELKFYCVEYEKGKLRDTHSEVLRRVSECQQSLLYEIRKLKDEVAGLTRRVSNFDGKLSTMGDTVCEIENTVRKSTKITECWRMGCDEMCVNSKYCCDHYEGGTYCTIDGCERRRSNGSKLCEYHANG